MKGSAPPTHADSRGTTPADEALVTLCREHDDERAFKELVRRYREPVFRRACRSSATGSSATQKRSRREVFLRVHHANVSFRGEAKFSSWLYRVTFNQAVNLKSRVRYRAPHVGDETLVEAVAGDAGPAQPTRGGPGAIAAVPECVAQLPEVYQSALRLHYWMGISVAEIAILIDVPENTVKSYSSSCAAIAPCDAASTRVQRWLSR